MKQRVSCGGRWRSGARSEIPVIIYPRATCSGYAKASGELRQIVSAEVMAGGVITVSVKIVYYHAQC